jgi:hypothetical protein
MEFFAEIIFENSHEISNKSPTPLRNEFLTTHGVEIIVFSGVEN